MSEASSRKTASPSGNPATTNGSRASITAFAVAVAGMVASVVMSPLPTSSASASCAARRGSLPENASMRGAWGKAEIRKEKLKKKKNAFNRPCFLQRELHVHDHFAATNPHFCPLADC